MTPLGEHPEPDPGDSEPGAARKALEMIGHFTGLIGEQRPDAVS